MAVFSNLRSRLKKRVQGSLDEPVWNVIVHGKAWLCPYCGQKAVRRLPKDPEERVEAILDHLVDDPCPDVHLGEGTLRPLAELKREAGFRELRRRVKKSLNRNHSWQLMDSRRRWFCPFCGEPTALEIPADRTMTEEVLRDICLHVEGCYAYGHGKGQEKAHEALKTAVRRANRQKKLADDVRKKLEGDPLWRQKDPRARWICPFCGQTLEHVDLSSNLLMFENAPALIAQHLLSPCEPFKANATPQRVAGQNTPASGMQRIVRHDAPPLPTNGQRTLRQMESSGEFNLIDDSGSTRLTGSRRGRLLPGSSPSSSSHQTASSSSTRLPKMDPSASVEWRLEIERELAAVRSVVPGGLDYSESLENTEQAEAREAARVAESLPGFEVRLLVRPAQPARGDFVEVIKLDSSRLGIIAGGVTGEEQEGALVAAMTRNLIRIHARTERDPAQVLKNVNAEVHQDLDARTFVAALYGVLDGNRRTLTLARAGITAPVLLNARRNPAFALLDLEGMVMGIDKGPIFDAATVPRTIELTPGDLVIFATNGLLELRNRNRDELGLDRYLAALKRFGTHEAEYLVHKLGQLLEDFTKDSAPSTDACVMALKLSDSK